MDLQLRNTAVRIGFVGAGLIANYHARSLEKSGAAHRIVAVTDLDRARAETFAARTGAAVCDDIEAVIAASDAVYVCTWTSDHAAVVDAAVDAGCAVFCEKPLDVDLAGARRMTERVCDAAVTNQVGLVLRSAPGFALLASLLADPSVGSILSVGLRDDQEIPLGGYYGSSWRGNVAKAGSGTLLEHSIHDLDILEYLCGPIVELSAQIANRHGHLGIEDTVAVSYRLAGGGTGVLTSVWHDVAGRLSHRRLEIFCERGRIWAEGNMAETVGWEYRSGEVTEVSGRHLMAALRDRGVAVPPNADGAFVRAVAENLAASPDFATALRAHVLVDATYRSAGNSTSVDTSPPARKTP